jgi:PAS domain S-box-containing protein
VDIAHCNIMSDKKIIENKVSQDASEELEELERYIEELSTFLPLPFCIVNPSAVILNVNQAFCSMTGYDDLEIVGERITRLFENEKEAQTLEERIFKEGLVKQEMNLVLKNNQKIIVSVSAALRKDKDGNAIGYFLAFSDISELKKLQKELEQKVEERTKQLGDKVEELERFNRLAVGREIKMIELKEELAKLRRENRV